MDWINNSWGISDTVQWKLLFSMVTLVVLWVFKYFSNKIVFKKVEGLRERYNWGNGVRNTYYILLLIIIGAIWIDRIGSLATFFGLVTAGLAIALQDPIVNFAAWFFIMIRRPFGVGDRIEIGDFAGDVIDIRFFQFTLNEINNWVEADQSTGRIIHVPNGQVFKQAVASYNQGFSYIWNEQSVLVTFESNWEKAREILNKVVADNAEHLSAGAEKKLIEASKKYMIFYKTLTPVIYTSIKDSGVMITMRYLVNPKKRRVTENQIWQEILRQFSVHDDIDFAYPTQRIYYNLQEGKKGAVQPPNYPGSAFEKYQSENS